MQKLFVTTETLTLQIRPKNVISHSDLSILMCKLGNTANLLLCGAIFFMRFARST